MLLGICDVRILSLRGYTNKIFAQSSALFSYWGLGKWGVRGWVLGVGVWGDGVLGVGVWGDGEMGRWGVRGWVLGVRDLGR
jgi:hypothetical protein